MIRFDRLSEGPVALAGRLPAEASFWAAPGLRLTAGPELGVTATAAAGGAVRVRGFLKAEVELECRRCLCPLPTPLPLELDLWFEPGVAPGESDDGVFGLEPDTALLDLREPLREELLLAVPEYPLCREDCRGLCPRCGRNRNEGPCGCDAVGADPRWASLERLLIPEEEAASRDSPPDATEESPAHAGRAKPDGQRRNRDTNRG